jgi:hypothetical protein
MNLSRTFAPVKVRNTRQDVLEPAYEITRMPLFALSNEVEENLLIKSAASSGGC